MRRLESRQSWRALSCANSSNRILEPANLNPSDNSSPPRCYHSEMNCEVRQETRIHIADTLEGWRRIWLLMLKLLIFSWTGKIQLNLVNLIGLYLYTDHHTWNKHNQEMIAIYCMVNRLAPEPLHDLRMRCISLANQFQWSWDVVSNIIKTEYNDLKSVSTYIQLNMLQRHR